MSFKKCFQDKPYFHIVFQKWFSKSELFFQRKPMKPIIFKIKNFLKLLGFSVPRKMLLQKHMKFLVKNTFSKTKGFFLLKMVFQNTWNIPLENYLEKAHEIFIIENDFPKNLWNFSLGNYSAKLTQFSSSKTILRKTMGFFIWKANSIWNGIFCNS